VLSFARQIIATIPLIDSVGASADAKQQAEDKKQARERSLGGAASWRYDSELVLSS
jgi:hypothetical protein